MSIDKEKFQELCAGFVLQALDEPEQHEFQALLTQADSEMRQIFDEMQFAASHLPLDLQQVEPSPLVKEQLFRQIQPTEAEQESVLTKLARVLLTRKPKLALAIVSILVFAVIGQTYRMLTLNQRLRLHTQELVSLRDELTQKAELLSVLQSPQIEVVFMNGTQAHPSGYGKIIWDPNKRVAILQVSDLPPAPPDKRYQLWIYAKDQPAVSAGVFDLNDPAAEAMFKIEKLAEVDKERINGFLVTLEPRSGVTQPTGPGYLGGRPAP
jgi:anti-sigma-K factor RskA